MKNRKARRETPPSSHPESRRKLEIKRSIERKKRRIQLNQSKNTTQTTPIGPDTRDLGLKEDLKRIPLRPRLERPVIQLCQHRSFQGTISITTYVVARLLVFVTLLVGGGLLLAGSAFAVAQGLPSLSEHLADLACRESKRSIQSLTLVRMTYRTRCRGSPRGPCHGSHWRRTCRQKDHAWGHWGLSQGLAQRKMRRKSATTYPSSFSRRAWSWCGWKSFP